MIRTFVIPLALAVMLPVAVATAADRMLRLTHEWQVSLDVAGKVTALRDRGQAELSAAVRAPLEQAIRGWTFEPGRIGGRPAPTETTLTLDVSFVPASGDRYAIRIDDARTGGVVDAAAAAKAPPRVPREAMRPGLVARVVVSPVAAFSVRAGGGPPRPPPAGAVGARFTGCPFTAIRVMSIPSVSSDGTHGAARGMPNRK